LPNMSDLGETCRDATTTGAGTLDTDRYGLAKRGVCIMSLLPAITLVECRMFRETAIESWSCGECCLETQQRRGLRVWVREETEGKKEREKARRERERQRAVYGCLCECGTADSHMLEALAYSQCINAFDGAASRFLTLSPDSTVDPRKRAYSLGDY
jgi:hypothetical protein